MFVEERLVTLFRRNRRHTLTYWSVFFTFGLCIAFLGPTILDLRCQTGSTLEEITWVFFSQQICLLIGSSVGGAFKKTLFSALYALFLSSLLISLIFAIVPLCSSVLQLAVAMAVSGLAMGIIDTIANIQLVVLYKKDSAIFLQALHFFIGCGALVSPLIADPFLSELCETDGMNRTDQQTITQHFRHFSLVDLRSPLRLNQSENPGRVMDQSSVSYAFWIMALINLPVPIAVFMLLYCENLMPCSRTGPPHDLTKDQLSMQTNATQCTHAEDQTSGAVNEDPSSCCPNENLCKFPPSFYGIHFLAGLVLFMTDGIVGVYAGFAYTYAVSAPLSLSARTAGYLPCIFWASITGGRLVSIPLTYRFKPVFLLMVDLVGVIVVVSLLMIFYTSCIFLFIGTSLLGLFLSSIFPCMLAYTEDILDYQGCATTVIVTCAGMGEMVLQVVIGSIIQTKGSYSFLLCGMIAGCVGFLLFVGLLLNHYIHQKGTSRKEAMVKQPEAVMESAEASEKREEKLEEMIKEQIERKTELKE